MKNIERFLSNYSWLLKLGIIISIFLWTAQGNVLVKKMYEIYKEENAVYNSEDQAVKSKAIQELDNYARVLTQEANNLSRRGLYGPKEYFDDLKKIRMKNKELYHVYLPISGFVMTSLQGISLPEGLLRASKHKIKELEEAREDYKQWLKTADVYKDIADQSFIHEGERKYENKEILMMLWDWLNGTLLNWLMILYIRVFFLILPLYLIRMSQRKGILETVLADKKKFALAVLVWPAFISKYPYNVAREIIVEAELRRLGNPFRKLSLAEKKLVQKIASSANYKEWTSVYRIVNSGRLQYTLLFTIVITVSIHAFAPLINSAEASLIRDGSVIMQKIGDDSGNGNTDDIPTPGNWCISEETVYISIYFMEKMKQFVEEVRSRISSKKVDHVSLGWLFGSEVLIPN